MIANIDLQKLLNILLLILAVCGGLVAGMLTGRIIDLSLGGDLVLLPELPSRQASVRQLDEDDFQVILDRNLFNSQAVGQSVERVDLTTATAAGSDKPAARPAGDLELLGTVVAGEDSLALIRVGRKAGVYRLESELAPGTTLIEVERNMVAIRDRGVRRELLLVKPKGNGKETKSVRKTAKSNGQGVSAVGENRWQISRSAATNARANLNSLLSTARMIPQMQNGKTIGFKLVEMERGSLLEQVGLKVGDLVVEINQVELNSPEKALQVFQQVREATNISLGLVRNGKRETFEYYFE